VVGRWLGVGPRGLGNGPAAHCCPISALHEGLQALSLAVAAAHQVRVDAQRELPIGVAGRDISLPLRSYERNGDDSTRPSAKNARPTMRKGQEMI
jgi:hypothetical protein